jgi:TP901 family phage tail tape measure protein
MTVDVATLNLEVDTTKLKQADRAQNQFGKSAEEMERRTRRATDSISDGFKGMGLAAARAAGAIAGAIAAAFSVGTAIQSARRYGAAVSEVSTLINATASEMALLDSEAKRFAETFGVDAASQVKGFYQAISAGAADVAAASKILDTANRLAIGGVTDVTTAVDILTTATNIYGASGLTAEAASDALFVSMRAGKTTIGELSGSLGKVLPLANTLGVSFDETAAAVAALTKGGISTAESVTGLRAAMTAVLGPSAEAQKLAAKLGIDFSAAGLKAKGFAGFMADVVQKTGGSATAMQQLFSSVEGTTVALSFAGQGGVSLNEIMGQMEQKAGQTSAAFDKMAAGFDARLNKAMSAAGVLLIGLGNALLTVLVPALEALVAGATFVADSLETVAFAVGQMDAALGASSALAAAINFIAQNLEDARGYAIATALALTAFYAPAIISATFQTGLFIASLVTLRGALVATGIGAFIVLAGLMINEFIKLSEKAGGFGNALEALGDVATQIWDKMIAGGQYLYAQLQLSFLDIKVAFIDIVFGMADVWGGFVDSIAGSGLGQALGIQGGRATENSAAWTAAIAATTEQYIALGAAADDAGNRMRRNVTLNLRSMGGALADDRMGGGSGGVAKSLNDIADAAIGKGGGGGGAAGALTKAEQAAKKLREEMQRPLVSAIEGVSNAFGDFVMRGFRDFKGFARSIVDSFKSMLSQMIAMAVRNRIMISLGLGGSLTGTASAAAAGGAGALGGLGGIIGGFGTGTGLAGLAGGTGLLGGFGNVVGGFASGGFAGAGSALSTALGGATTGAAGFAGAVGAIAVPLLAVGAIFSFFKKKVTELDSGLNVTVGTLSAAVETFRTIETKRFFGLSKKVSTSAGAASAEVSDPIVRSVTEIQQSILTAAEAFGFGADAFSRFSYRFNLSLKGLTQEQALQKVNEELAKMGDAFAGMLPSFSSMNELLEAHAQRIQLEDRLLQLQGKSAELLARQRERELLATHELNRPLLMQIHALEDQAQAAQNAANQMQRLMQSNLFETSAERQFAATSFGFTRPMMTQMSEEERALMREIVTAIREGDINQARLTNRLVQMQERQELEPVV